VTGSIDVYGYIPAMQADTHVLVIFVMLRYGYVELAMHFVQYVGVPKQV